jgi:serine/threonine protein kinase
VKTDHWAEVERLFHEVLKLSTGDRAAFVAKIDDPGIRAEIISLLATESQPGADVVEAVIGEAAQKIQTMLVQTSTGALISHFRIVREIGRGAMGEVYLAHDLKLGRQVALKLLPPDFLQDSDRLSRFEREGRAAAALNHPNIMAVYEVGHSAGQPFIAAEYVAGETLADRLSRGRLPEAEAIRFGEQIVEALAAAHEKGVVHRDLKPANIKITPDKTLKVLDFGLAKLTLTPENPDESPSRTHEGMIFGTPAYMSPEQARGAHVDKQADTWAFGVLMYEMLTGKRPFERETITDTLAAVIKDEPDLAALPARMRAVIGRCLRKDVRERWHDIGDVRIAFEESRSEPLARPGWRGPWIVAALASAAALIAAIAILRPSAKPVSQPLIRLNVDLGPEASLNNARGQHLIAISPDGSRLAFACGASDTERRICTRRLDQAQPIALAGTEGVQTVFFSPDGKWIGFSAHGKLRKVSVEGGAAITLCDAPFERGASWSEDGFIIASLNSPNGLARIPENGGAPQPLTQFRPGEQRDRWPQVLPGVNAVLFTASTEPGQYENASIDVVSVKTGDRKTLHRGGYYGRYLPGGRLIYMHKGTLFAARMDIDRLVLTSSPQPVLEDVASRPGDGGADFDLSQSGIFVYQSSRSGGGQRTVQWLHKSGRLEPLLREPAAYDWIRFSPDGKRLALIDHGSNQIWVRDLEHGTMSRITFGEVNDTAVWSPDSKHLAYAVSGKGNGLWWARADGSGPPHRLSEIFWNLYSFSPDGARLAASGRRPDGGAYIATIPLEGSDPDRPKLGAPEPFLRTSASEELPAFSPDGRWLAYTSDESGSSQVYVRPFPGPGGKWQISTEGATNPIWSRNAHELFYISSSRRIMGISYRDRDGVFIAEKPAIWSDLQLPALTAPFDSSIIDLAPDGKRFAILQNAESQKPLTHVTVLLNFFDELRRKTDSVK